MIRGKKQKQKKKRKKRLRDVNLEAASSLHAENYGAAERQTPLISSLSCCQQLLVPHPLACTLSLSHSPACLSLSLSLFFHGVRPASLLLRPRSFTQASHRCIGYCVPAYVNEITPRGLANVHRGRGRAVRP